MLPTTVLDSSDSLSLSFQSWEDTGFLGHPGILPSCPSHTTAHAVRRIPWCPLRHRPPCCPEDPLHIPGFSLGVSPETQAPILSGGSLAHPGILPWCPLRQRPPCCPEDPLDIPILPWCPPRHRSPFCLEDLLDILPWCPLRHRLPRCPEDPLDIPGSFLGVLSDTGPHPVRKIPWTSRDSSRDVPSDTGPHAVRRIPWTSRDPPLVSSQTQAPILSRGFLRHPGILPLCLLRHRSPCCLEDPRIPCLPTIPVQTS